MQALSLKALKFLQKMVLNIISLVVNIEVLSHDNCNSHSFSLDGLEFGAWIHH